VSHNFHLPPREKPLALVDHNEDTEEGATPRYPQDDPREHTERVALDVVPAKHKSGDEVERRVHREHETLTRSSAVVRGLIHYDHGKTPLHATTPRHDTHEDGEEPSEASLPARVAPRVNHLADAVVSAYLEGWGKWTAHQGTQALGRHPSRILLSTVCRVVLALGVISYPHCQLSLSRSHTERCSSQSRTRKLSARCTWIGSIILCLTAVRLARTANSGTLDADKILQRVRGLHGTARGSGQSEKRLTRNCIPSEWSRD
jgi:hypothetical protein